MSDHDHSHDHDHDHDHASVTSAPARGASVRLRNGAGGGGQQALRMDPANQSLAEALRFTYGLLKFVMIALVVLFVFSGVKTIKEGQRGIKVLLGKPVAQNLSPGPVWTLPFPLGEIIQIGEGTVESKIGLAFMPYSAGKKTDEDAMGAKVDDFNSGSKLEPGRAGSNITADLNIAHTQWTINYRRTNHERWAENVLPEQEDRIVRVAVQRGVVQTVAGVTIDDLLKQSGDSISARVREIAQDTLDEMKAGITVDRIVLSRKIPPIYLNDKFNSVQAASQNAGKQREDALLDREKVLNETAGAAAPVLIEMINEYERLIELGEAEQAEALLVKIDDILEGRATEFDGKVYAAGMIAGEVSGLIEATRGQVSTMVAQSIADRDFFRAKLAQYQSNPRLMIVRDWSSAMGDFLGKDFVQAMMLPKGVSVAELLLNEDPSIVRELDRAKKRAEAEQAREDREATFRRDLYRSMRGIQESGE